MIHAQLPANLQLNVLINCCYFKMHHKIYSFSPAFTYFQYYTKNRYLFLLVQFEKWNYIICQIKYKQVNIEKLYI